VRGGGGGGKGVLPYTRVLCSELQCVVWKYCHFKLCFIFSRGRREMGMVFFGQGKVRVNDK